MQAKTVATYSVVLGILLVAACSDIADPKFAPRSPNFYDDVAVDSATCAYYGGCREPLEDELAEAMAAIAALKPEGECGTLGALMLSKLEGERYKIIPESGNPPAAWGPTDGWVYVREGSTTMATGLKLYFPHEAAHQMGFGISNQTTVDYLNTYQGGGYALQEDQRATDFAVSCWS